MKVMPAPGLQRLVTAFRFMKLIYSTLAVVLAAAVTSAQGQVAQWPTPYTNGGSVSQDYAEFGMFAAQYHAGLDIADPAGTDVRAPVDGV